MPVFIEPHLFVSLDGLPSDILSQIASDTFLLASNQPTYKKFASIVSLLFTCRSINTAISINNNPGMYALIFRHLFDTAAIRRRLGDAALYSRILASCLKHRIVLLKRIESSLKRRQECRLVSIEHSPSYASASELETYIEMLRDCMLLLIEKDTRNLDQLNSVGVRDFVYHVLGRVANASPIKDTIGATVISLGLAVIQMLDSQDTISQESSVQRTELLDFLQQFVHPQSWEFKEASVETFVPTSALPPLHFEYFGAGLSLTLPSISLFARLCTMHRYAALQANRNRFCAQQGSSVIYDEFWSRQIHLAVNSSGEFPSPIVPRGIECLLETPESHFHGYFFIPHPMDTPPYIFTCSQLMALTLREYHCYSLDSIPLMDHDEASLARAWFPEGISIQETQTSLHIYDAIGGRCSTYWPCEGHGRRGNKEDNPVIYDTILVGKTDPLFGDSFGQFKYHGRVRGKDRKVAIVRKPIDPQRDDLGIWVFYGYVYQGLRFVGDWRVTSTAQYSPGRQGWLDLTRNEYPSFSL